MLGQSFQRMNFSCVVELWHVVISMIVKFVFIVNCEVLECYIFNECYIWNIVRSLD